MNLADLIKQIRIDSEYGPSIVIDAPFSGSPSGSSVGGSAVLGILKPQITIVPAIGGIGDKVVAPWGVPGPTRWPYIEGLLVIIGIIGVVYLLGGK